MVAMPPPDASPPAARDADWEAQVRVVLVPHPRLSAAQRQAIARDYGMRDGRVFDFVKNETPAHMRDKSLISRFFRGVGPKQTIMDDGSN